MSAICHCTNERDIKYSAHNAFLLKIERLESQINDINNIAKYFEIFEHCGK